MRDARRWRLPIGAALMWLIAATGARSAEASPTALVRFAPEGPPGVGLTGEGGQKEHVYYQSTTRADVSAGVWTAEPYEEGPLTPDYSEFMLILEGSVTLTDASGREETFRAGDAVLVPRGVTHRWRQTEPIRKYWVIFDHASEPGADERSDASGIIRFAPRGPSGIGLVGEGATREHTYYAARGEAVSAGVWEADPSPDDAPHTWRYAELMCLLEGSVTLVDPDGREEHVAAGDVVLIPRGATFRWVQPGYVRKYWVIFDPE